MSVCVNDRMGVSLWTDARASSVLVMLAMLLFTIAPRASAKCANGTVTVQGRVENLDSRADLQVVVVVQTAKYSYSQAAPITNGQFQVEVLFSHRGSYSPLWGEHCSNPKTVDVEVKEGEKVLVQRKLKISADFEPINALSYKPKRDLILDASGRG